MLQLKHMLPTFLKCEVRNGLDASFWWDSWTSLGPLMDFVGQSGPRMLRLRLDAKVGDAVRSGEWYLPNARSDRVQELQILLTATPPPEIARGADTYLWRNAAGNYAKKFSSRGTWEQLRTRSAQVPWSKIVWFREAIPRASFIMWLVCLGRLPTRDRLIGWGMTVPDLCPLCLAAAESHSHLFFSCTFSEALWQAFATPMCGQIAPSNLADIIPLFQLPLISSRSQVQVCMKLLLQVVSYSLWRERNARIFTAISTPLHALKRMVDRTLRDRLLSFPATDSHPSLLEFYFGCMSHPI
ncbi:unnamed protein product [Microthlaspi erraticum]|uniref:Reverse transcriptase zinc-binding domain-containing protein n=1 Tax=Microthlaspi erraticum TaxID=1685480 RepID=A0A6D2KL49_9BRAS|nr:unnamed protein product [Microthlaspi erraticum]CAA7052634.1 unnamed protein product [Microthlaspi erraticum]